jgi:hypothetical protein
MDVSTVQNVELTQQRCVWVAQKPLIADVFSDSSIWQCLLSFVRKEEQDGVFVDCVARQCLKDEDRAARQG